MAEGGSADGELEPLRLRRLRGEGFFEVPAADRVRGWGRVGERVGRGPSPAGGVWVESEAERVLEACRPLGCGWAWGLLGAGEGWLSWAGGHAGFPPPCWGGLGRELGSLQTRPAGWEQLVRGMGGGGGEVTGRACWHRAGGRRGQRSRLCPSRWLSRWACSVSETLVCSVSTGAAPWSAC